MVFSHILIKCKYVPEWLKLKYILILFYLYLILYNYQL